MKKLFLILLAFTLIQCNNEVDNIVKNHPTDPFVNTMVESQLFSFPANDDYVLKGKEGTVVVFPKGCFLDSNGDVVEKNVDIELAEALSLEDMLISNLTTTSKGQQLETGGMLYLNATSKGEQLHINGEKPIYIEVPTAKRNPGMMVYKGVRDENGDMDWVNPEKLNNFLTTVDLSSLDFYPTGFEDAVKSAMPFRGHKIATKELTDSLYYSLTNWWDRSLEMPATDYNEPYIQGNYKVIDGKYTDESFEIVEIQEDVSYAEEVPEEAYRECAIDPAWVKTLKSDEFSNSFIATKAFEKRMKAIHQSCHPELLTFYIQNIDQDLWVADSLAAQSLIMSDYYSVFLEFSKERLSNVEDANKYGKLLKKFYKKQLEKIEEELQALNDEAKEAIEKDNLAFEEIATAYKELLFERESFRMETYSYEWTGLGWMNIDTGIIPKDFYDKPLVVTTENGGGMDRAYVYVVFTKIQSLYRLNSSDQVLFHVGSNENSTMKMPKNSNVVIISIAYKGDQAFIARTEIPVKENMTASLSLEAANLEEVKEIIGQFDAYESENKIDEDLAFMHLMYTEDQRQAKLKEEEEVMQALADIAYACCIARDSVAVLEDSDLAIIPKNEGGIYN